MTAIYAGKEILRYREETLKTFSPAKDSLGSKRCFMPPYRRCHPYKASASIRASTFDPCRRISAANFNARLRRADRSLVLFAASSSSRGSILTEHDCRRVAEDGVRESVGTKTFLIEGQRRQRSSARLSVENYAAVTREHSSSKPKRVPKLSQLI